MKKLPRLLDIFSPFTRRWAQCIHVFTNGLPVAACLPERGRQRRIPADGTVRRLPRLPEREVADVLLVVFVGRAARARALVVEVDVRELAVAGELRDGEVDAAVLALVGDALLHERLDEGDHLGNVVRRGGIDLGRLHVELPEVGEEGVLVRLRVVRERDALRVRALDRLVVDVREVHHLAHLHAVELDHAAEDVLEGIGAEVPDVGEIVDGRPARVEKYVDLLEKCYIIFKLNGFSRNLRTELKRAKKFYFYDNGIRNAILQNFAPLALRQDVGALWENFFISERIKANQYCGRYVNSYFWRTNQQQEIDYIEECDGQFSLFEMKWNPKRANTQFPNSFLTAYDVKEKAIVTPENWLDWVK